MNILVHAVRNSEKNTVHGRLKIESPMNLANRISCKVPGSKRFSRIQKEIPFTTGKNSAMSGFCCWLPVRSVSNKPTPPKHRNRPHPCHGQNDFALALCTQINSQKPKQLRSLHQECPASCSPCSLYPSASSLRLPSRLQMHVSRAHLVRVVKIQKMDGILLSASTDTTSLASNSPPQLATSPRT